MTAPGAAEGQPPARVVHISDCYPPRVGGIETQVHDLAARQAAAGYDVHVLTATAGEGPAPGSAGASGGGASGDAVPILRGPSRFRRVETWPSGVTVHRLASRVTLGLPVTPGERALIARVLGRLGGGGQGGGVVVHVHAGVVSPFAFAGVRAAAAAGLPTVVTWHCMLDGLEPLVHIGARALGLAGEGAPFVATAVSEIAAARVAEALGRRDVGVVPNGLDLAAWADASRAGVTPRPPLPPAGPLRLVATQRLAPRKRTEPLVRAVLDAHRRLGCDPAGPRVHLTLLGGGPAEPRIRSLVAAERAQDVVDVRGRVPRESLPGIYAGAHAFVSPARLEAFGIAALEARACGLAVLAARDTGPAGFLSDGVDALLVGGGRAAPDAAVDAALTDAIVDLARHPDRLARLVTAARGTLPDAGWDAVLAACADAYAAALAAA